MVAVETPTKAALSALPRRCKMGLPTLTCNKVFQNAHLVPSLFREGDHKVSYREGVNTVAMLEPVRDRHTRLPEHLPAATFHAQPIQNRIAGVERNIQPHREGPLERRAIE